jgi:DNA-binding transcriptional LysR family regulator
MAMVLPEIRFLRTVIVLAEELNFTRAAKRLHIEQPALSRRIMELESLIGFRLFERNKQMVELTEAGRKFVEEAREAILHAERAVSLAKTAFHGADEILNIGKSAHTDPFLVSTVSSIQLPLFPGLKVKLWSNYSHELARQVMAGTLDLALITGVPDTPKLSVLKTADHPFYIAMAFDDALAEQREIRLEDMHARNWILFAQHANPHLHEKIQRVASERRILASDIHYVTSAEEASELIRENRALAFLTRTDAWRIAKDGITMRPLAESRLRLVTNLAVRSDTKSRLINEFVRATARKLGSVRQAVQGELPLAG